MLVPPGYLADPGIPGILEQDLNFVHGPSIL